MQAQAHPAPSVPSLSRRQAVIIMAILWTGIHVLWLLGPVIAPDHDFEDTTWIVTSVSLALGLAGLLGLWSGMRWGWWVTLLACVMNVFLAVPEAFALSGVLRVVSILVLVVLAICLILLFRPGVRPVKS